MRVVMFLQKGYVEKSECFDGDVMNWKRFPQDWPFVRGEPSIISGFPSQRASNAELWCFFYVVPKKNVELMLERPVIWDTMTSIMWHYRNRSIKPQLTFIWNVKCFSVQYSNINWVLMCNNLGSVFGKQYCYVYPMMMSSNQNIFRFTCPLWGDR